MIKIEIDQNHYETDSPIQAYAFAVAVVHYGYDASVSKDVAMHTWRVYTESNDDIDIGYLTEYVCTHADIVWNMKSGDIVKDMNTYFGLHI